MAINEQEARFAGKYGGHGVNFSNKEQAVAPFSVSHHIAYH